MQLMSVLQRQILLTLSYSNVFSQPLTKEEIEARLIAPAGGGWSKAPAVDTGLAELAEFGLVRKNDKFWQLASLSANLAEVRKRREAFSQAKLNELQPFLHFCQQLTWIMGIAVTGSVSVMNAEAKDDVDLMVVVRSGRLWLVRPLLVFYSFLKGKRRSWNHEEENSWCLNLWLEETELAIKPANRNIYVAYEVFQARWVLIRHNINQQFLEKNAWIQHYLSDVFIENKPQKKKKQTGQRANEVLNWLNRLAYVLQRWYMQPHITREKVGLQAAFFHPRDTKNRIISSWKQELHQFK